MFWSGWVKDCEGRGPGWCWTGDGGAAIFVAPVKGATKIAVDIGKRTLISIHAPRRERPLIGKTVTASMIFQSALPRKERPTLSEDTAPPSVISIHAPAKGATPEPPHLPLAFPYFNPRSREGSDFTAVNLLTPLRAFQSTLPRRERHRRLRSSSGSCYFNPRSREGSDVLSVDGAATTQISIHAPAKGATTPVSPIRWFIRHFNPRSREGSDATAGRTAARRRHFNPRSREGSDISLSIWASTCAAFQSTLP